MSEELFLERRYRVALEAAQIGIWTWCRQSPFIVWDDTAAAMIGAGSDARL